MSLLTLGAVLLITLSQGVQQSGSYKLLSGARLTRFQKSQGRSEAGHNIQVRVRGDCLKTHLKRWNRAAVCFTHGHVRYVIRRDNPYLVQTLRKLRRPGKQRTVILKGRVMAVRAKKGAGPTYYVWVRTLQAIMAQGSKKRK